MVFDTTSEEETCASRINQKDGRFLKFIRRRNRCSVFLIFGSGIIFLIFGSIICTFWRDVFLQQIAKRLPLSNRNDSQTTKVWLSQKVPQYLKVYMFNWTNSEETLEGSEIPHFTECGPYVFLARVYKEEVVWNDNYTVSYLQRRRWDFVPEMSNGSLTDEITSINVVAVAFAYQIKQVTSEIFVNILNNAINLKRVPLIVTKSVESQLFEGYDDGILSVLNLLSGVATRDNLQALKDWKNLFLDFGSILTFSNKLREQDNTSTPTQVINKLHKLENIKDKFGWWYQKNLTETHYFNVHTGEDNVNFLGSIHSWDNKDVCKDGQKIQGSLGDLWPMNGANAERALLFVPDMCSLFDLINSGPTNVYGIEGIKFIGTRETMGPSMARKSGTYEDTDLSTGIRNITSIVKAPIFISFPHFYQANEEYRLSISGMKPDKQKHEFWLVLQKDAGVVLEGRGRIQINIMVEPSSNIDLISKMPSVLFPTIWFEQTGEIPSQIIRQMQFGFVTVPHLMFGTGLVCVIIAILFLVSGIVLIHLLYKPESHKKILTYLNSLISRSKTITVTVQKPIKL